MAQSACVRFAWIDERPFNCTGAYGKTLTLSTTNP